MRSKLHNIRKQAMALRQALVTPSIEGLDSQLPALQEAAQDLESLSSTLIGTTETAIEPGLRRELEALAQDLAGAGRLIAQGLAFQLGLARLLAAATSGYRPDGEPAALNAAGSISVRG
jgi:hypothetical protein